MSQIGMGILHLIITLSMIQILLLSWKKKSSRSHSAFLLIILATIVWNFCNAMEYLSSTEKAMIFWHELKFLGVIPTPLFTLIFAFRYCKKEHLLSKKLKYVIYTLPLAFLFFIFTDPVFHLFRKSIHVMNLGAMRIIVTENRIIFLLQTIFGYTCMLAAAVLFINRFYELPKYYRGQVGTMLISMLPPWLININFMFSFFDERIDLTSISFVLTGLMGYWTLFHYSVPEIIPIARDLVIENMHDLVIVTDINNRVIDINLSAKKLINKSNIDVKNSYFEDALNVILRDNNAKLHKTENGTEVIINRDEGELYYSMMESPIRDGEIRLGSVILFHDITNFKRMMNKLQVMATTDQLTGLYNRIYLDNYFKSLKESKHLPIAILKGGINGLKVINDAFGLDVGDEMIIRTAHILRKNIGKKGIISRVGGDEFAIILPNTDENMTHQLLEKISNDCSMSSVGLTKLSICFGYSIMKSSTDSVFNHVKQADNSMYRKKMMESRSTRSAMIESLKTALEQSDFETKAHAERTQKMALKVGKKVGLDDNQINDLSLLAVLHDIGKIAVPHHILMKPGKLTDEEFEIIKTHTEKGYNIALSSPDLVSIAHGILHHHERWDGKGYPMGLKGEAIPIESRIICIVDSYDVMTNERPYHKPISKEASIQELRRCKGTQFDPNLVDIMIDILEVTECEGA